MAQNSAILIDYRFVTRYDVQPYFGAGSVDPVKWIHRRNGDHYSTAALLDEKDSEIDNENNSYVVASSGLQGIAGATFYQVQAEVIKP